MIIEQLWTGNSARNFFYLIACSNSGEALAIDPIDPEMCLSTAKKNGWNITRVLNKHEHKDHTGGNEAIINSTNAKLLGPANADGKIANIQEELHEGDVIDIGNSGRFNVLETPGHTPIHISLFGHTDRPHLFCGDTLFNAGVGHCHSGDPEVLYETFIKKIAPLPDDTLVYPGHDYMINNLDFTLDREPDNQTAKDLKEKLKDQDPNNALISDLGIERNINTFLRLDSPTIIDGLKEKFSDLPSHPETKSVFLKLRELRNSW